MRICVTGGSGFIASYFHPALRAAGHETRTIDLAPLPPGLPASHLTLGDIRDRAKLVEAMDGCDAVLHLAAAHHDFGITRDEYFSVNEGGAQTICEAMDALGITNVCFYSSVAVYGDAPEPRTEATVPMPSSPYGQSKLAAEKVFQKWCRADARRNCLVIRPTVTFGPRNFANMYSLIRQIHSGRFLRIGSGRNIKSLSYVENIVAATLYLWNLGATPRFGTADRPGGFEVYNYIDKPDLSSAEVISQCYVSMGRRPPRLRMPLWLAVVLGLPFDAAIKLTGKNLPISTARMRKLCTQTKFEAQKVRDAGFVAAVPLAEGIDRMVKWYLGEGQYQKPLHATGGE